MCYKNVEKCLRREGIFHVLLEIGRCMGYNYKENQKVL